MLADEIVFSVENEEFCWRDVVVAAARGGDWDVAERRTREGEAAVRHDAAVRNPLTSGALDAAGREFRYARNLITAQSMEQWLADWGLTAKEWSGYLLRKLSRQRWLSEIDSIVAEFPLNREEAAHLTVVDVICSGELEDWARRFAARAAAATGQSPGLEPVLSGEPLDLPASARIALGSDVDRLRESSQRVRGIEARFESFRAARVTEPALQDYVSARQLDLVQFHCRTMSFRERDMAAEAAFLLRDDGERFTSVYSVAQAEPRAMRFFYDHIDSDARDLFLSASAGDLVGPVRVADEYILYFIQDKVLPTMRDPDVRRRAEEGVLQHALSRELDRRVRWHVAV